MPTIQLRKKDLDRLIGRSLNVTELSNYLSLVKGEVKELDEPTGEMKIELNDTNRPDLWCVEGISRQVKIHLSKKATPFAFFNGKQKPAGRIEVAPNLKGIRPFIGACIARGLNIDNEMLVQLIQTQEKLSDSFGRHRRLVSIGLYRMTKIIFPVCYKAVDPDEAQFVPLGFEEPMTLREILEKHPKGVAYAPILSEAKEVPLLVDKKNRIMSFPPIINSREIGEVQMGDRDLFVEVTGTNLRMVILTVNILAANLADRGANISAVEVRYPYATEFGRNIVMPGVISKPMDVPVECFTDALGEAVKKSEIASVLRAYGYQITPRGESLSVSVPAYRDDLLHPVDVVEDFAISRGYESFTPEMPSEFTIGGLSPQEQFSDRIREALVGMGFQEVISNILTNREESSERMNLHGYDGSGYLVEVDNVMSQTYSALRDSIIPSLLRVESASSKSFYPHLIFESGETAKIDGKAQDGTKTILKTAALLAHPSANFSELHSYLDLLMYYIGARCKLQPVSHPSFIAGRVGRISVGDKDLGLIGELHPAVLEKWQITMPTMVFEIDLDILMDRISA